MNVGHGCVGLDNMDRSTALVHRLATQCEQIAGFAEIFSMSDKQHTAWLENPVDSLQHTPLGRRIKVDQHVAAENHVEGLFERPVIANEIDAHEVNHASKFGLSAHHACITKLASQKELLKPLWTEAFQAVDSVYALRSRGQHPGVNVTCRQFERCIGTQCLESSHDDGIRLLACGRRIAPHPPVGRWLGAQVRSKNFKVVVSGFAKGVDKQALDSAIKYKGQSIIVLPQGITTFQSGFKTYYKQIVGGDVLVLSTFPPKSVWSTGLAMARNPIIYGLSDEIYVAESSEKGGTWSGVIDGLRKGRKIYVRKPELNEKNANLLLIQKGALAVDHDGAEIAVELLSEPFDITQGNVEIQIVEKGKTKQIEHPTLFD